MAQFFFFHYDFISQLNSLTKLVTAVCKFPMIMFQSGSMTDLGIPNKLRMKTTPLESLREQNESKESFKIARQRMKGDEH